MGEYIDFSELPSDEMLYYYKVYENVIFCVTIFIGCTTIFVIIKASTKSMQRYKWYLVNELTW